MTTQQARILVVDDEQDLCDILRFNLQAAGYEVATACSAEEALLSMAQERTPDLLLLDVMMGAMSGFELAQRLRSDERTKNIPIIFLTAKDTEDDTLKGFSVGADDYISKPFSLREVMARVGAVLRRTTEKTAAVCVSYRGIVLDPSDKTVTVDGQEVAFTKTEFELLLLLAGNPGQVYSRHDLLHAVWPEGVYVTERTIDVNITRIRKKIKPYDTCLATRQGYGYYLEK